MASLLQELPGEKAPNLAGKRAKKQPGPFPGPPLDTLPAHEGITLAGSLPPDQFFALANDYPNKSALVFYLYRQWPIINRKLSDINNPKNIAKYGAEGGDLRKMIHREHGSGEYSLKVVDPTRPKGQQRLAETEWTFSDADLPPQLDVDELVLGHPRNRSFEDGLRRLGKLKEGVNEVADTATEQLGSIANRALDELAAARKKPEPVASSDNSLLGIVQMLFTQQQQAAQQQTAMMMELFKSSRQVQAPPPPAATSLVEQLALLRELRDAASDFGGGSARPVKSTLMEHVISALAPSLPQLLAVLTRLGTAPAVGAAPVLPVAAAPVAGQVPASLVPEAAPVAMVNHPIEGVDDVTMKMGLRFMDVGQQALKAFERGKSGDAFADALHTMYDDGEATYEALRSVGFDGIMQVVQTLPAWSTLAGRRAEVEEFVKDFIEYGDASTDEAEQVAG